MSETTFPEEFKQRVLNDVFLGEPLLFALEENAPTSIRYNPLKTVEADHQLNPVPWCKNAYYLKERPLFTKDPLFHAGVYYPQEAGSMFLEKVLLQLDLPDEPLILDLCAAPGGKSTLIASFLDNRGLLVSNEVIQNRAKILKENLTKWGYGNTFVVNNDPKDFQRIPHFFDLVVVDAPCSGEGMFRKDKQARNEWSEEHVSMCASRQKRIVMDVWDSLKPGGFLIYSTCTFNEEENEENIAWFLKELHAEIVHLNYEPLKADRKGFGAYSLPSTVLAEGFYISVLQKSPLEKEIKAPKLRSNAITRVKETGALEKFIHLKGVEIYSWSDFLFALPDRFVPEIKLIQQELRIVKFGSEIGTFMKNELQPHEALALNPVLLAFQHQIPLTLEQALKYLKGETFDLPAERAYYLLTYQHIPLGWIKHIGNRFNNLYPKEWRIRMSL